MAGIVDQQKAQLHFLHVFVCFLFLFGNFCFVYFYFPILILL